MEPHAPEPSAVKHRLGRQSPGAEAEAEVGAGPVPHIALRRDPPQGTTTRTPEGATTRTRSGFGNPAPAPCLGSALAI